MELKFLIVDDEESICKFIEKYLVKKNHHVDVAHDVSGAISFIDTPANEYDIVITDKNMPYDQDNDDEEGGMYILRYIKNKFPQTQVIMITGYATIQTATQALKLGAFDYLTKPFSIKVLQDKINRIVEYRGYINPDNIISIYKDIHNSILEGLNKSDKLDDDALTQLFEALKSKIDLFFRNQRKWETVMVKQRDALSRIGALAEQLADILPESDPAFDLIRQILAQASQRI